MNARHLIFALCLSALIATTVAELPAQPAPTAENAQAAQTLPASPTSPTSPLPSPPATPEVPASTTKLTAPPQPPESALTTAPTQPNSTALPAEPTPAAKSTLAPGPVSTVETPTLGPQPSLIICTGLGGSSEYSESFAHWADNWRKAGAAGGAKITKLGENANSGEDLAKLQAALQSEPTATLEPLWLILIGHGTYDGREAKFNLRGADLTPATLSSWLAPFQRPVIVIATFSSSGAFLAPLSKPGRIILTATKSGSESNYSRLGQYLSEAIADLAADLDHDGQTSLLEAWISAARQTADFYKSEGRLATEHSLLDDNGDGHGTPADWYSGLQLVKKAADKAAPDGPRTSQIQLVPSATERAWPADLRAKRDALELEIVRLRNKKPDAPDDEYYVQLETILIQLAKLYRN